MRIILAMGISVVFATTLVGCDRSSDTFGASYDECILKNLKQSTNQMSAQVAESCQRHFEKAPNIHRRLPAGGSMERHKGRAPTLEFRISNPYADTIVTGFTVTVRFYRGSVGETNLVAKYDWSYRKQIAPLDELTVYGTFDAASVAELKKSYSGDSTAGFDSDPDAWADYDPLADAPFTYDAQIDLQMKK